MTQSWTQIYEGLHQGWKANEPKAEVVFVHGLGAHWLSTWHPTGGEDGWMQWLGRDLPGANVYALDYEVARTRWSGKAWPLADRAEHMLLTLHLGLPGHLPIILIGHSMGGLHIKKMLEIAVAFGDRPQWQSVVNRVHAVAFFATPHSGSILANWATALPRALAQQSEAIDDLRAHASNLRELDERFRQFVKLRSLPVLAFHETEPLPFMKTFVVDQDSANPKLDNVPCFPSSGNHSTMCKFVDDRRVAYRATLEFVGKVINVPPAPPSSIAPPSPKPKMRWWERLFIKLLGEPTVGFMDSGVGSAPSMMNGLFDLSASGAVAAIDDSSHDLAERVRERISAAVLGQAKSTNFYALGLRPNPRFVGREQALKDLLTAMFPPNAPDSVQPTALTQGFAGEGGIGKSQLAQRFAERACAALGGALEGWDRFDCAWWLDCAAATHAQAVRALAEHLGHTPIPQETPADHRRVIQRLLSDGRRHLLILDNLEPAPGVDPAARDAWSLVHELALPPNGRVLLTTRDKNPPVAIGGVVRLEALTPDEARTLLRSARADLADEAHSATLTAIAEHLGRLALAVDMARAWLTLHPGETPRALLDQLKGPDEALVEFFEDPQLTDRAVGYRRSVAAALTLHLPALQGTPAEALLNAAAYCAPNAIPGFLLRDAAGLTDQQARDGLAQLVSKSLIHHEPGPFGGWVYIHRLTQTVVRARLNVAEGVRGQAVLKRLFAAFHALHKEDDHDHVRPLRTAAALHIEAACDAALATASLESTHWDAAVCHRKNAEHFWHIGDLASADRAISKAMVWAEGKGAGLERDLMVFLASRASIHRDRGDLAGAEADIQKCIDWGESQSPRDERSFAIWYASRAGIREDRGDLAGAEADIRKSIDWGEAQSPRDERSLAIGYALRARIRRDRGDLAGAEADIQRSIDWGESQSPRDERALAIRYASRASIRLDQAIGARKAGDGRRAAVLFEQSKADIAAALSWWEKNLPNDERVLGILRGDKARIDAAAAGK